MSDTMSPGKRTSRDGRYLLWFLFSIPALILIAGSFWYVFIQHDIKGFQRFPTLRWSGIVSCIFLILTMSATPLALATKGGFRWLRVNRRYLGVASFAYAALHLAYWLIWTNPHAFLRSFIRAEIITGWIAFFIMAALAWTSTDAAVRRLGPKWKALQRWVYPAAILTFLHWLMTAESLQRHLETLILSAPLIALSVWRFGLRKRNS